MAIYKTKRFITLWWSRTSYVPPKNQAAVLTLDGTTRLISTFQVLFILWDQVRCSTVKHTHFPETKFHWGERMSCTGSSSKYKINTMYMNCLLSLNPYTLQYTLFQSHYKNNSSKNIQHSTKGTNTVNKRLLILWPRGSILTL